MALLFWTPVLPLLKHARRLGRPLKTSAGASAHSWASPPAPVLPERQIWCGALAFSPPHHFRSKSSHSPESKDTTLSTFWVNRISAFKLSIWSWTGCTWALDSNFFTHWIGFPFLRTLKLLTLRGKIPPGVECWFHFSVTSSWATLKFQFPVKYLSACFPRMLKIRMYWLLWCPKQMWLHQ